MRKRHTLPSELTTFVGRERELAELRRLLGAARLLTLVGPGGIGKSRLALHVAAQLADRFVDGVWVVELGALGSPTLVPSAIASTLEVVEQPGRPLPDTLADALRSRQLLLVLDNCEHLAAACGAVAERLLGACACLRILATSRVPLGVPPEVAWALPSLALPAASEAAGRWTDGSRAGPGPARFGVGSEAAQLFLDRAASAVPGLASIEGNLAVVDEICRCLEGVPLAIELAAARVRLLTLDQIATQLRRRSDAVTDGDELQGSLGRALHISVEWSYALLGAEQRTLLRRMAVFAGGCTLDALEAVCAFGADGGRALSPARIPELVADLVDAGLVLADGPARGARYRLLATIRGHMAAKLRTSGEEEYTRERHRDWFLALAEQVAPGLQGQDQAVWLDRVEQEHDNLRAALRWSAERGHGEPGLRLVSALFRFWRAHGYLTEARNWAASMLDLEGASERSVLRCDVLFAAGWLARLQADLDSSEKLLEESEAIAVEHGYQEGIAGALTQLGHLKRATGEYASARSLYERALQIRRETGFVRGIAISLGCLGRIAFLEGDLPTARTLCEESLELNRQVANLPEAATVLAWLGELAVECGALDEAYARYVEGLTLANPIGDHQAIVMHLEGFAALAAERNELDGAIHLAGAARALREMLGMPFLPLDRSRLGRRLAPIWQALGEREAADLWPAVRSMTLAEAIEYALTRVPNEPPAAPRSDPRPGGRGVADEPRPAQIGEATTE